jgi:hypothetical protein
VGLLGASDEIILEFAADSNRIVLTHDKRTMPRQAYDRLKDGQPLPGLFIVDHQTSISDCIDDLLTIAKCSNEDDWRDRVIDLPLK